jgi:predicted nucleotidyltransferase component of viral defense system
LRQVEQDLIISRAIVDIFSDAFLRGQLRFRGGTALNKLHFPVPTRFSQDIDLVRTTTGPVGPILARVREVLEPWLGHAAFDRSQVAPKLRFRTPVENSATPSE